MFPNFNSDEKRDYCIYFLQTVRKPHRFSKKASPGSFLWVKYPYLPVKMSSKEFTRRLHKPGPDISYHGIQATTWLREM